MTNPSGTAEGISCQVLLLVVLVLIAACIVAFRLLMQDARFVP